MDPLTIAANRQLKTKAQRNEELRRTGTRPESDLVDKMSEVIFIENRNVITLRCFVSS